MYVVLVPNIGISTSISNTTQIRPQQLRNFMSVHWECTWCQCQILVLAPAYPTLQKYAHSTSERSCVSTGNVRAATSKYWYQHQHIQHYTNTPTVVKKLHVCPLGMYVVLVPNIGICTSISNTTQIRPQHFRNFMCVHWECTWILVPNIGICTSISNTTQIRPQHFRNFMCVHWECAWCQCQILVLAPAYPTLHKYAHRSSETSCVSTGNVHGASAKYWYQHQHIKHYTNALTAIKNFMGVHWARGWSQCQILVLAPAYPTLPKYDHSTSETSCVSTGNARGYQCQIFVLAPAYPTLHKYAHSSSDRSCVSTGNVRAASAKYWYQHQHIQHYTNTPTVVKKLHVCPLGMCVRVSAKYWYQHQHIQHYTNTPTALQKLHVCPLGMYVVLVPNVGISTRISNITQIRLQYLRNLMCLHWECAWCQCQILVLAPAYPTLQKYAHSS